MASRQRSACIADANSNGVRNGPAIGNTSNPVRNAVKQGSSPDSYRDTKQNYSVIELFQNEQPAYLNLVLALERPLILNFKGMRGLNFGFTEVERVCLDNAIFTKSDASF